MNIKSLTPLLVLTAFLASVSIANQFLAFTGWLYPVWAAGVLLSWLVMLGWMSWQLFSEAWQTQSVLNWFLVGFVLCVWLVLVTGILVPEVAFDAVWYHLPVAREVAAHGGMVYIPELYQSLNPQATDLFFVLGWLVAGGVGTKIVAFLWFVTLQLIVFHLAKKVVSLRWAVLLMIQVALFQVVAWQSTSFYVDIGKAVWELLFVYLLTELTGAKNKIRLGQFLLLGIVLGNSIATKQFSILLVPLALWGVWQLHRSWQQVILFISGIITAAASFYIFAWYHTGTPLFSIFAHTQKIAEIGRGATLLEHLLHQLLYLPLSWWGLLTNREYVSPLVFVGLVFGMYLLSTKLKTKVPTFWWWFAGWQWLVWWFVPPLSTRYALSGFMILTIIGGVAIESWSKKFRKEIWAQWAVVILSFIMLAPRLYVVYRNWPVITGRQTQPEYIESKYDGWIDQHLQNWYGSAEAE